MHLKLLFGLLPLFTAATALAERGYVVPEDLAPGFYVVSFHDDGNSTVEKVDVDVAALQTAHLPEKRDLLSTGSAKFPRQHLTKRTTYGATGRVMVEHDEYNALTVVWRDYLNAGNTLPAHHIYFSTTDHLVLACCVYGASGALSIPGSRVDDYNGFMDRYVGYWQTGWANEILYSFWRDRRGHQICGNLNGGIVPK